MQFVEPVDSASNAVLLKGHQLGLEYGELQRSSIVGQLIGDRLLSLSLGSTQTIAQAFGRIASENRSALRQPSTWITEAKRDKFQREGVRYAIA
jgi:hypothetical protein